MENYELKMESDMIVVAPEGEITSRSYPEFEEKLTVCADSSMNVLFDMQNVTFINSVGIVFLLRMREMAEREHAHFVMYGLSSNVERIVRRLQLIELLNVVDNIEICLLGICEKSVDESLLNTVAA